MKDQRKFESAIRRLETYKRFHIYPAMAMECRNAAIAYHGGPIRAAIAMIRWSLHLWLGDKKTHLVVTISDYVGWTKLHPISSDKPEFKLRHGYKCSGSPNCSRDCITECLPKWFRWATRWHK